MSWLVMKTMLGGWWLGMCEAKRSGMDGEDEDHADEGRLKLRQRQKRDGSQIDPCHLNGHPMKGVLGG